jgi:hypothetical protein
MHLTFDFMTGRCFLGDIHYSIVIEPSYSGPFEPEAGEPRHVFMATQCAGDWLGRFMP